jgi:aminoglycoside phosphotransferase (APT) family kinase protein
MLGYDEVDTEQGTVEYICMTRVPGVAARHVTLSTEGRHAVIRELGTVLRVLHATPVDTGQLPTDAHADALRQRLVYGFGDIADVFAEQGTAAAALPAPLDELIDRAIAALPDPLTPVALHSNPSPTHVFVDPATGRFTGVIDFGDAYASHPALDLHRWPDPADRVLLREAYLDGAATHMQFDRVWTTAMIYTDLAVIASSSAYTPDAAVDLAARLDDL